jgi:multidrug efflux pump subunit AcrA (membrane-fusion protein)
MKRSDLFIRLTTAVLFLAVASYIGVYIYNAVLNPYEVTVAISYDFEETLPAFGYIVRTETVIVDSGISVMPIVREGEKVASGQAVAVEYMSREALETASELRALRLIIAKLEAPGGIAEASRLNSVMALSTAVQGGDLSRLDELSLDIETYIFASASNSAAELPALRARLETLEARRAGMRTISAPVSGVFSQVVDGQEFIEPRDIMDITPSRLAELFRARASVTGAGKLVTEFKWYYSAVMDAGDAVRLREGRSVTVHFSGAYNQAVEMQVERVGRREDGKSVVLFSSDRGVHDIVSLRELRAEVVFGVVSGIRVPKGAIHLDDDGTTFIFLQTGVRAERVNVEILQIYGDSYIVRDGAEAGTPLRAGSTIIVRANNLYHNKIVA